MTEHEIFDSNVWIDYLIKGSFSDKIEQDDIFSISSFSLFEIKKKLLRNKMLGKREIEEKMSFIKSKSIVVNVDEKIAEKAAEISEEKGLGAGDAIIYASAIINNSVLLTLDNDFRGLDKVKVL
ncbi:MAG: PIN domain-containing protein [Nanoarchaeota archaeon]